MDSIVDVTEQLGAEAEAKGLTDDILRQELEACNAECRHWSSSMVAPNPNS
jgi:hypothetical protein